MTMLVVGVCGRKRHGKDTVAEALMDHLWFKKVSLAAPIAKMVETLCHEAGVSPVDIVRYLQVDKEIVIPELGTSYRRLAQTLGTEWGRGYVHEGIWTSIAIGKIARSAQPVVTPDVRRTDEWLAIREAFPHAKLLRVVRPDGFDAVPDQHVSESTDIDVLADHTLMNDGTVFDLQHQAVELCRTFNPVG
jgi:hypothetical protein